MAGVEEALVAEFHARGEGGLEARARYSVLVRRPRLELGLTDRALECHQKRLPLVVVQCQAVWQGFLQG